MLRKRVPLVGVAFHPLHQELEPPDSLRELGEEVHERLLLGQQQQVEQLGGQRIVCLGQQPAPVPDRKRRRSL
jgi:hypothetical protein